MREFQNSINNKTDIIYNTQLKSKSCNKPVDILQQADIGIGLHELQQLVDKKSATSYQQTCSKLIVKTCYPQGVAQIVGSLQMTSCYKPDLNRFVET